MTTDEELKQYGCIRKEDIQEHIVHNMAYELYQIRHERDCPFIRFEEDCPYHKAQE
jgi:hypothetical protein